MKANNKKLRIIVLLALAAVVSIPAVGWLVHRLEGRPPEIRIKLASTVLGPSTEFSVNVSDPGSGLRRVQILLLKDGGEAVLSEQSFASAGPLRAGKVTEQRFIVLLAPAQIKISDGEAAVRVVADDHSWRRWGDGNRRVLDTPVEIDTRPPALSVVSRAHNIAQGGSALIAYRIDEDCPEHGVRVGDRFFPGRPAPSAEPGLCIAFFALGHDQGADTPMALEAADRAGNRTKAGFAHYIRKTRFAADTIRISDRFLAATLPNFDGAVPEAAQASSLDRFLAVNRDLRRANYHRLTEICAHSDEALHWRGAFLRLPGSARQSGFGDRRQYRYRGDTVDRQIHLGIDLASVRRAPVPAANAGRVALAGELGIYGQTVVIDHGYGLFSMYAHLSRIDVNPDDVVSKGDPIGLTGKTGLAGGDHLHFSMIVAHTFVDPVEWWDADWIRNNVTDKIEALSAQQQEAAS